MQLNLRKIVQGGKVVFSKIVVRKNTKFFAFIIALILPILFLWITVFSGAGAFNLVPFEIHEAISPGGTSEGTFIVVFDVIIALLLRIPGYKIANKILSK